MSILRDHGYKPWSHLRSASDRTCVSANHSGGRRRSCPIRQAILCDDSTASCCFSRHGPNILLCRLIVRHVRRTRVSCCHTATRARGSVACLGCATLGSIRRGTRVRGLGACSMWTPSHRTYMILRKSHCAPQSDRCLCETRVK